jgi:hypothetical protein
MTIWIPSKFAKTKKLLKVKIDGEWEYGWMVASVYSIKITELELNNLEGQYRTTRTISDI